MAKYQGKYECGCEGTVNVVGKQSERAWKIEKAFARKCEDCWKKDVEVENAKAAKEAEKQELPALQGTEKQVAWANTIRANILKNKEIEENIKKYLVENKTSAKWYIDNRALSIHALIENIEQEVIKQELKEKLADKINSKNLTLKGTEKQIESAKRIIFNKLLDFSTRVTFYSKKNEQRSLEDVERIALSRLGLDGIIERCYRIEADKIIDWAFFDSVGFLKEVLTATYTEDEIKLVVEKMQEKVKENDGSTMMFNLDIRDFKFLERFVDRTLGFSDRHLLRKIVGEFDSMGQ